MCILRGISLKNKDSYDCAVNIRVRVHKNHFSEVLISPRSKRKKKRSQKYDFKGKCSNSKEPRKSTTLALGKKLDYNHTQALCCISPFCLFFFLHRYAFKHKRAWQPTPVFLPGESPRTEEPGRLQFTGSQRVRQE